MLIESLAYQNARTHVQAFVFQGEELMDRHNAAMECQDCEAFLQMGIESFDWIIRADNSLRAAAAAGKFAFTEEVDLAFKWLAKAWLKPCTFAEQLIRTQTERNFQLENLAEFQKCCEEMRAIVAFNEQGNDEVLPEALMPIRNQAILELKHGQTSEFLPGAEPHIS